MTVQNAPKRTAVIRQVWAHNVEAELTSLSHLLDEFDHVAIDTEFPGIVVRLVSNDAHDSTYQTLRHNVDLLKIIQLGLTLSNERGESPEEVTTWQFNFSFSLSTDMYAQDSIDLLTTAGIDFAAHERDGIDVFAFGELLTSSGLVVNPKVKWIAFHGAYDFAYLVKVLTDEPLPKSEREFFHYLRIYFPTLFDLKQVIQSTSNLFAFSGLNKLAEQLGCQRIGTVHQAGSDSLLTLDSYMLLRDNIFKGSIEDKHMGHLYGMGAVASPKQPSSVFSPTPQLPPPADTSSSNGNPQVAASSPPAALTPS